MTSVLLVDDHPALRAGVRRSLEADPDVTVVGEAADGDEALRLARELDPDVVVLDLDLPGLPGVEVARALRSSRTRVLAFTAHAGRGFVQGLLEAGVAGYITKDQPEGTLVEAVKAVARGDGRWLVVPHDPADPFSALSERERDILVLLARGLSNAAIAETLFVSESTVRNTLTAVYQKIGAASSREAVAWAWAQGLGPRTP
jgi:DNA-binding NarL/FixJ family response regulator